MARTNRRQESRAQLRADVHHCLPAHEHQGSHAQICHFMQSVGTQMQRGEAALAADASINVHLQILRRASERGEAAPVWHWAPRWGQSPVRSRVDWAGTGAGARPRLTAPTASSAGNMHADFRGTSKCHTAFVAIARVSDAFQSLGMEHSQLPTMKCMHFGERPHLASLLQGSLPSC